MYSSLMNLSLLQDLPLSYAEQSLGWAADGVFSGNEKIQLFHMPVPGQ